MKTQEEILERFNQVDDIFRTQKSDLIDFMSFDVAKPYLQPDYVSQVEAGEQEWKSEIDSKSQILDYLPFAYDKAESEGWLSAARSMLHFKTWIWLDDEDFYNEVSDLIDNYTDYGIPALNKISTHYGYKKKQLIMSNFFPNEQVTIKTAHGHFEASNETIYSVGSNDKINGIPMVQLLKEGKACGAVPEYKLQTAK